MHVDLGAFLRIGSYPTLRKLPEFGSGDRSCGCARTCARDPSMCHAIVGFICLMFCSSTCTFITRNSSGKKKKKLCRQREHTLHQLRKRRRVGSKSHESLSPEGKMEASVGLDMGSIASPAQKDCVNSDLSTLKSFAQFTVLLL
eukprot:49990-Pelagomonas_calceolata.AAC.3